MEMLELLNEFENTIEECSRIPMTGKIIIHEDVLYAFIDKMRGIMPETIQEAQWVLREKERIISEAEKEASSIVEAAESKIQRLAGESEIVKLAKTQSEEIIENSKNIAREVTQGSLAYADDVMNQLHSELEKILSVVKKGREELRQSIREKNM